VAVALEWELRFRRRFRRDRLVRVVAPTLSAAIAAAREQHDLDRWRFASSRTISGGEA